MSRAAHGAALTWARARRSCEEAVDMRAQWLLTASLLLAGMPAAGAECRRSCRARPAPAVARRRHARRSAQDAPPGLPGGAAAPHGVLDRPSRCRLGVSGAHARSLRGRVSHGCGHARVRRDVHQGSGARLPALAERSRDDDGHLAHAARADLHRTLHARRAERERCRRAARASRVPHERAHARRVQVAAGQGRCVRSGRADRRAVRDAATCRTPGSRRGRRARHAAHARREHRVVSEPGRANDARAQGAERRAAVQRAHARAARPTAHR